MFITHHMSFFQNRDQLFYNEEIDYPLDTVKHRERYMYLLRKS